MTDHELKTIETIKSAVLCGNDCPSYGKDYDLGLCTCYKHHTIVTVTHAFEDRKELSDRVLFLQGQNNISLPQLKDILDKSVKCVECHAAISGALESYLPQGIAKTFHYGKDCSCDNCKRVRESATIGSQNNLIDGLPKE